MSLRRSSVSFLVYLENVKKLISFLGTRLGRNRLSNEVKSLWGTVCVHGGALWGVRQDFHLPPSLPLCTYSYILKCPGLCPLLKANGFKNTCGVQAPGKPKRALSRCVVGRRPGPARPATFPSQEEG